MLHSICRHLYNFTSTRVLALTSIVVRQLVFEHCLRMRFLAETPDTTQTQSISETASTNAETAAEDVPTPDSTEIPSTESPTRDPSSVSEVSTVAASEPSTSSTTSTLPAKDDAKSKKAAEPSKDEEKQSDKNLIGKINNLVTSDLGNIVGAKDFLGLSQSLVFFLP